AVDRTRGERPAWDHRDRALDPRGAGAGGGGRPGGRGGGRDRRREHRGRAPAAHVGGGRRGGGERARVRRVAPPAGRSAGRHLRRAADLGAERTPPARGRGAHRARARPRGPGRGGGAARVLPGEAPGEAGPGGRGLSPGRPGSRRGVFGPRRWALLLLVAAGLAVASDLFLPAGAFPPDERRAVLVERGQSLSHVASELKRVGLLHGTLG